MKTLQEWLDRKKPGPKARKPIPRIKPERAKQVRAYNKRVKEFLKENPICGVWLKENGWESVPIEEKKTWDCGRWYRQGLLFLSQQALIDRGAPRSDQCHHVAKRRGAMLLDERFWLAVCRKNHERTENDKTWARANGFLLNF